MAYQSSSIGSMMQGNGGGFSLQSGNSVGGAVQSPISINAAQPASNISVYQPAATADVYENSGGGTPLYTGDTGSTSSPQTVTDPWAGTVFGSTAGYNAAKGNYTSAKDSLFNSVNDAVSASGTKYNSSILDYLDARRQQQNTIDSNATQNELAREQGMQGIMDMIGNGINSSGSLLGNKNAGSSSATDGIARAYGTLGRQQASGVGNQFAQGQDKIATDQNNLLMADSTQTRHSQEDKTATINDIVNSARSQMAALNTNAMYANLPDQLDIEAKVAEIKQNAINELSKYDGVLSGGISGQTPMTPEQTRAKATQLLTAGVAPESQFNYTSEFPAQFQDTGQFSSSLPIFIAPSSRKQLA